MKRKVSLMVFVFFYLSCIAIMDYPYLARIYNGRVQGKAVTEYEETIEKWTGTCGRNNWRELRGTTVSLARERKRGWKILLEIHLRTIENMRNF